MAFADNSGRFRRGMRTDQRVSGRTENLPVVTVIGGGLAGCEAAWQAARLGAAVRLFEMRPLVMTPAHRTDLLAELVCSNSLGSASVDRAAGMLLEELRLAGSLLRRVAEVHRVPAGQALAVDRYGFAREVTRTLYSHPAVKVVRREIQSIPDDGPVIVAAGPLASPALCQALSHLTGEENLFFFDAIAPMVTAESVDRSLAFSASRYGHGEDDYLNCPLTEEEYRIFVRELRAARRAPLRGFEAELDTGVRAGRGPFFERCLPVEILAARGDLTLAHGPMRPTGLVDPRTGKRPFAVLQLRRDDVAGQLYNLVGMQTNLLYTEQERVFRLIPALHQAEFARYGQMHRNTFLCSPKVINAALQSRLRDDLFFAGQLTGIEGYAGNIASGWLAGVNAARLASGQSPVIPPPETMIGALCRYVSAADPSAFQPMKANFGLLVAAESCTLRGRERHRWLAARGLTRMQEFLREIGLSAVTEVPDVRCD